jgi:hypothetical protein
LHAARGATTYSSRCMRARMRACFHGHVPFPRRAHTPLIMRLPSAATTPKAEDALPVHHQVRGAPAGCGLLFLSGLWGHRPAPAKRAPRLHPACTRTHTQRCPAGPRRGRLPRSARRGSLPDALPPSLRPPGLPSLRVPPPGRSPSPTPAPAGRPSGATPTCSSSSPASAWAACCCPSSRAAALCAPAAPVPSARYGRGARGALRRGWPARRRRSISLVALKH